MKIHSETTKQSLDKQHARQGNETHLQVVCEVLWGLYMDWDLDAGSFSSNSLIHKLSAHIWVRLVTYNPISLSVCLLILLSLFFSDSQKAKLQFHIITALACYPFLFWFTFVTFKLEDLASFRKTLMLFRHLIIFLLGNSRKFVFL